MESCKRVRQVNTDPLRRKDRLRFNRESVGFYTIVEFAEGVSPERV